MDFNYWCSPTSWNIITYVLKRKESLANVLYQQNHINIVITMFPWNLYAWNRKKTPHMWEQQVQHMYQT